MLKELPTLYKKTNTGAIQQWSIKVDGTAITVEFGQVGGAIQSLTETISSGKNEGKANATSAEEQALKEAKAKHKKQVAKRYVTSIEMAEAGDIDTDVILGGIAPMLAPSKIWPTFRNKMKFPVFVQPKLDGHRLIAVLKDGKCTLWSRTQKPINSLPHIIEEIESQFGDKGDFIFDGEAYNHEYRNNFEELSSKIRSSEPEEGHWNIQYHMYDLPSCDGPFSVRWSKLWDLFWHGAPSSMTAPHFPNSPLGLVGTSRADNDEEIEIRHEKNLQNEYEGSMIRNDGPYEQGKRSYHLQKYKSFIDWELPIVGVNEGRGKDAGTVGSFVCALPEGGTTDVRLKASYDTRKELFENPKLWQGMDLTLKYQNKTADGKLRFSNGKEIVVGKGLRKDND